MGICSEFSPEHRVAVDVEKISWVLMPTMMAAAEHLFAEVQKAKVESKANILSGSSGSAASSVRHLSSGQAYQSRK